MRNLARLLPILCVSLIAAGCKTPAHEPEVRRFEFSEPQMGAPFRIVLYAADEVSAKEAAMAAFRRVSDLNDIMSDYDTDSELNRLSRTSGEDRWVPVSADLWAVLVKSQDLARRSDGAFDVTSGPCVNLWRKARREKKMPEAGRLAEAKMAVGYEKLVLSERHAEEARTEPRPPKMAAKLMVPGMKLDLGGIAKGYAVDEALKVLRRHGIKRALVAAAGDIGVSGAPPGKEGWRIELPGLSSNAVEFVTLKNAAVSTSGDLFQHVELDGKRYSHIVDPKTCVGLTDRSLVTVIARDCTTADSVATAVSVMGPQGGLKLVKEFSGAKARVMRMPGGKVEVYRSWNWRKKELTQRLSAAEPQPN